MNSASNRHVVLPIAGEIKAKLQKEGFLDLKHPKLQVNISLDGLRLSLEDLQYRKLLTMVEYLSSYSSHEKFSALKPKFPPYNKAMRKEWMNYGVQSAIQTIRSTYFTWSDVEQRKTDRVTYIELYKRSKEYAWLEKLNEFEQGKFKDLEHKLAYEDIVVYVCAIFSCFRFRELAYREVEEESKKYNVLLEESKKTASWFSWSSPQVERAKALINEEDREKLYKAIGYDVHEQVASNTLPSDVWFIFFANKNL